MRVADAVAQTLADHGARLAFGMPGGEVLTLVDALNAAGVTFVLARQETSAAIMAAGAAVTTGSIGVLVTTLGPGLANAVNGIADASQEHVPLIVLTGVVDHSVRHRYTHQVIDHGRLLSSIVKATFEVETTGVAAVVARAIAVATALPMGPVLIQLSPETAQKSLADGEKRRAPAHVLSPLVDVSDPALDVIRKALSAAKRPLIIAGFDAARTGAAAAVTLLAERFKSPVITTYKGKGVIAESHQLSLGGAGLSPLADRALLPIAKAADVVILAGYDPIEMRQAWLEPFAETATVIEITPKASDHAMHRTSIRIEADIAAVLSGVVADAAPTNQTWPQGEPSKAKADLATAFASSGGWGPHAVISSLNARLPADATVTVDSGAHRILLSQMMRFDGPMQLLQSAGFCTMGAAIPLAVGVKSTARNKTVIAVLGDGGLEMGIGELATLRDQSLAIPVIVFQDESLALIELKQRQAKLADAGVRLGRTAFEDVARAFGGHGARVLTVPDFERELDAAFQRDTFSLIVCEIKASDYADRL